ncbi:hypothetical protein [Nocardia sp. NBC_00403]|uniref:hypothetical protein n=1 Tax=Nocardia sp. NBC_00403 TaxID=2975990 RepID=UPI002E22CDA3
MSRRVLQRKYRVGWRTLASTWPRKAYPQRGNGLDPFKPFIDEMLRADLSAPRKQRHTITCVYRRPLDEHDMTGVSYQRGARVCRRA